jgi:hypothetical protein
MHKYCKEALKTRQMTHWPTLAQQLSPHKLPLRQQILPRASVKLPYFQVAKL